MFFDIYTCFYVYLFTFAYITQIHTRTYTHTHTHTGQRDQRRGCNNAHKHLGHTHIHTQTHVRGQTHTYTHIYTHIRALRRCISRYRHTHTRRTHTHTHTHIRASRRCTSECHHTHQQPHTPFTNPHTISSNRLTTNTIIPFRGIWQKLTWDQQPTSLSCDTHSSGQNWSRLWEREGGGTGVACCTGSACAWGMLQGPAADSTWTYEWGSRCNKLQHAAGACCRCAVGVCVWTFEYDE